MLCILNGRDDKNNELFTVFFHAWNAQKSEQNPNGTAELKWTQYWWIVGQRIFQNRVAKQKKQIQSEHATQEEKIVSIVVGYASLFRVFGISLNGTLVWQKKESNEQKWW